MAAIDSGTHFVIPMGSSNLLSSEMSNAEKQKLFMDK